MNILELDIDQFKKQSVDKQLKNPKKYWRELIAGLLFLGNEVYPVLIKGNKWGDWNIDDAEKYFAKITDALRRIYFPIKPTKNNSPYYQLYKKAEKYMETVPPEENELDSWKYKREEWIKDYEDVKESKHKKDQCMRCSESPDIEVIWADGRARAWFCEKHFEEWKSEEERNIVKEKKVESGEVSKNVNEQKQDYDNITEKKYSVISLGDYIPKINKTIKKWAKSELSKSIYNFLTLGKIEQGEELFDKLASKTKSKANGFDFVTTPPAGSDHGSKKVTSVQSGKMFAKRLGLPFKQTLKREERTISTKTSVKNKKIILYDDIVSTGVTLKKSITALNDSGVDEVLPVVIGKGLKFKGLEVDISEAETFIAPDSVAKIAKKALEWRKEFNRGGTQIGVTRANQLSNQEPISLDTVKRMKSYFARHEVDKEAEDFNNLENPSAGRIAWDLWGGDPGKEWVDKMLDEIQESDLDITEGIRPAFGSPGGKKLLAKRITEFIPDHKTYVEPFAGGATVFFRKKPSEKEVLNDKDSEIAFAYDYMSNLKSDQIESLQEMDWDIDKNKFEELKKSKPSNKQERFYKHLNLTVKSYSNNKKSFNANNSGNGRYVIKRLPAISERLKDVIVLNEDFKYTKKYDSENTFYYIDPPYPGTKNVGSIYMKSLKEFLKGIKGKFILSFSTKKGLSEFHCKKVMTASQTAKGGGDKKRFEYLISNFPLKQSNKWLAESIDNKEEPEYFSAINSDPVILVSDIKIQNEDNQYDLVLIPKVINERQTEENLYQSYPDENKKWEYGLQHHYRGKTCHADLRLEYNSSILGWTIFDLKENKIKEVPETIEDAKVLDKKVEYFKANWETGNLNNDLRAIPKDEGIKQFLDFEGIIPKGQIGATEEYQGIITLLDKGRVQYGSQLEGYHEYFLSGGNLEGRIIFNEIESDSDDEVWILKKVKDQTPYVLSDTAIKNKWLPPEGISALPEKIRKQVPVNLRYWKTSGNKALEMRNKIVEYEIIEESKEKKSSEFIYNHKWHKENIKSDLGKIKDYCCIYVNTGDTIIEILTETSPVNTSPVKALIKNIETDHDIFNKGKSGIEFIDPGDDINISENIPAFTKAIDWGFCKIIENNDETKVIKFQGDNGKLNKTIYFKKNSGKPDIWIISESKANLFEKKLNDLIFPIELKHNGKKYIIKETRSGKLIMN